MPKSGCGSALLHLASTFFGNLKERERERERDDSSEVFGNSWRERKRRLIRLFGNLWKRKRGDSSGTHTDGSGTHTDGSGRHTDGSGRHTEPGLCPNRPVGGHGPILHFPSAAP